MRSRPHASYLEHLKEGREKAWKEMRKGRVLSITSKLSPELLEGIKSSPMVRAAKLEPDRSVSCDGRFCHDQRKVLNEAGIKWDHPPALQPTHGSVGKAAVYYDAQFPGQPILSATHQSGDTPKRATRCS